MAYSEAQRREHVATVQRWLRQSALARGRTPVPPVDGIYGSDTRQAVTVFQRSVGLPQTGKVDLTTWNALYEEHRALLERYEVASPIFPFPTGGFVLRAGAGGGLVYMVQSMLNALASHFSSQPAVPYTGTLDADSRKALAAFQRASQLPPSGELDLWSWNRLAGVYDSIHGTIPLGWEMG